MFWFLGVFCFDELVFCVSDTMCYCFCLRGLCLVVNLGVFCLVLICLYFGVCWMFFCLFVFLVFMGWWLMSCVSTCYVSLQGLSLSSTRRTTTTTTTTT